MLTPEEFTNLFDGLGKENTPNPTLTLSPFQKDLMQLTLLNASALSILCRIALKQVEDPIDRQYGTRAMDMTDTIIDTLLTRYIINTSVKD